MLRLSEQLADAQSDLKELDEAINVGNETLDSLEKVLSSLKSASNWGTWDLLGGRMIATAIKHSRIDEARMSVHRVQQLLRRFQEELAEVEREPDIAIEIGSFATFADYFFDGLIADWVVQSRIESSLENVVRMEDRVRKIGFWDDHFSGTA